MNNLKIINIFIFFILLIISFSGIEECEGGVISSEDVPCLMFYPITDTTLCNQINISHYSNETLLYSMQLSRHNTVYCNSTFNITSSGTFSHKYTDGGTGSIIVEKSKMPLYLLYFILIITIALYAIGYKLQDVAFLGVGGLMTMTLGVFILTQGFNGTFNLLTKATWLICLMIGFYVMIRAVIETKDMNSI